MQDFQPSYSFLIGNKIKLKIFHLFSPYWFSLPLLTESFSLLYALRRNYTQLQASGSTSYRDLYEIKEPSYEKTVILTKTGIELYKIVIFVKALLIVSGIFVIL